MKLETKRMIGFERHARSIYLSFPCNISLARQIAGLFSTWFLAEKPAMAMNSWCTEPVFGVSNISIDQRAETASIARDIGVRKAAEQAFSTVLDRIL